MSDHPKISFESEVLSTLAELDTGQKYIKENVDAVREHLKTLNGSVKDLYNKHHETRLQLEQHKTDCPLNELVKDIQKTIAVDESTKSRSRRMFNRWYDWLILVLATLVSAFIINRFFPTGSILPPHLLDLVDFLSFVA